MLQSAERLCYRENRNMKDLLRLRYFQTREEEWFAVIQKVFLDQQATVRWWNWRYAEIEIGELVMQKVWKSLQCD